MTDAIGVAHMDMATVHRLPHHHEEILSLLTERAIVAPQRPMAMAADGSVNTVLRMPTPQGEAVFVRLGPDPGTVADGPSWLRGDALASEAMVLGRLGGRLAVLPSLVAAGFRETPAWLVQEPVPGRSLAEVRPTLAADAREAVWRAIGAFTRDLHDVPGPWFGTPTGSQRFAAWPDLVRADAEGLRIDALRFGLDPARYDALLSMVDRHADALGEVRTPQVVHSDLDARHVFVRQDDAGWSVSGVIDWEYARFADPWSESLLVALLDRAGDDPERAAFLAGYGADPATRADPAFRARQAIYRGIAAGWADTDAARLAAAACSERATP